MTRAVKNPVDGEIYAPSANGYMTEAQLKMLGVISPENKKPTVSKRMSGASQLTEYTPSKIKEAEDKINERMSSFKKNKTKENEKVRFRNHNKGMAKVIK